MSDEQNTVKHVMWSEVFSFPHIFKGFKMAVHPSKLVLGLVLLGAVFGGGYVLDWIWGVAGGNVLEGETNAFVTMPPDRFEAGKEGQEKAKLDRAAGLLGAARDNRLQLSAFAAQWRKVGSTEPEAVYTYQAFGDLLADHVKNFESDRQDRSKYPISQTKILEEAKKVGKAPGALLDEAQDEFDIEVDKIELLLGKTETAARKKIDDAKLKQEERDKAMELIDEVVSRGNQALSLRKQGFAAQVRTVEGIGVFSCFVDYQLDCIDNAIMSVRYLNFTGGLAQYQNILRGRYGLPIADDIQSGLPDASRAAPPNDQCGLIYYLLMMAEGVRWLLVEHTVFGVIFLVWTLAVWSLLGGAIYRIAAVHFAREEKISIGQALRFSRSKCFSFFCAPLVPIVVILACGLLLAVGGLVGSIPFIGPFIMAVLFGLAILIGVGIAFMLIGLVAGLPLMYPAIAVEGSDSFDALSRSVSYVFARPFRAILYGVVAAIYGTITYLFVRLFAFIALLAAHTFVKWGVIGGGTGVGPNADALDVLWARPTFWDLWTPNAYAMGGFDSVSGFILSIWVLIVAGLVTAYLVTYFASASTSIYYILRRRVDATDLDDVYVEEEPEELPAEAMEPEDKAPAPEPAAEEKPAEEPPAEEKPAETVAGINAVEGEQPPAEGGEHEKGEKEEEKTE